MGLQEVYETAVRPALGLLPVAMTSPAAIVWLLTVGQQESSLTHRFQLIEDGSGQLARNADGTLKKGPARGLWGFEMGGGTRGVLFHPRTGELAIKVCQERGLQKPVEPRAVWEAFEADDVLAAAFARLLMWTDGYPLPRRDDLEAGWQMYATRLWRPGRPRYEHWSDNHARSLEFFNTYLATGEQP